jgi:predicted acylesterase/phospholipase RssA
MHIGVLKELERYGSLQKQFFKGVYGCSVGAACAIGIAFGFDSDAMMRMASRFSTFNGLFDTLSVKSLEESLLKKGLFSMDAIEHLFLDMFDSEGLDLRNKKLSDSQIPLFICSTNITKNVITVFKGDVPVLTALRASACIPFVFCPEIINQNLYIDGGYLTNTVLNFIPPEDRDITLSVSIVHEDPRFTPRNIKKMSPTEFSYGLYKLSCIYERKTNRVINNIELSYNLANGLSDVGKDDMEAMIAVGKESTRAFLAKRTE